MAKNIEREILREREEEADREKTVVCCGLLILCFS
jgi:hypothetical protein